MKSTVTLICLLFSLSLAAEVRLPDLFTDHMVLQRNQPIPVWGWADPGETVEVRIHGRAARTTASADGRWKVYLDPLPAGGPHRLGVTGKNVVVVEDVLVGEVWVCSGQSNMQWTVSNSNDADLERIVAHHPQIRLITVPQVGTQQPQDDFEGRWEICSSASVMDFSAVGYNFGRFLHAALGVPVGLIDNAWGGSAAEAWVDRPRLEADPRYAQLLDHWKTIETTYDAEADDDKYEEALEDWKARAAAAREAGTRVPNRPRAPRNPLVGQHRPANLYQGVLHPILGYGIRGVIWYQGESNASAAYQYRHLFPLMISAWREDWGQGDFPFYWVQLADFRDESPYPQESSWAELREAQTMTLSLPHTGEAVILGLGEAADIHPRNKQDVAYRLVRLALARDYGFDLVHRSPVFQSASRKGSKMVLKFDHVGGGLDLFDVREPLGFAIAGEDRQFVWAQAEITAPDTIEVWSPEVPLPASVRYAWADNPVCNVQNKEGLPLTPFRTDDWPGVTIDVPHRP